MSKRYVYVKENLTIFEYEDFAYLVKQEIKTFGLGSIIGGVFSEISSNIPVVMKVTEMLVLISFNWGCTSNLIK